MLLAISIGLAACQPPNEPVDPEAVAVRQELRARSEDFSETAVDRLMADSAAMDLAEQLFRAHCASCHGPQAQGSRGIPDLSAGQFSYGASAESVRTTITRGRRSVMPAMGRRFGEVDIGQIVAYVQSLGADTSLSDYEERGRQLFSEHCVECHGDGGRGIPEQGTSSLGDEHWQHGESMMSIRLVITRGAESSCPAQQDELSTAEIDLLTAFVLRQPRMTRRPERAGSVK